MVKALRPAEVRDEERWGDEVGGRPDVRDARASRSLPKSFAESESTDDAPETPPVKKYSGISHVHTGSLITGRS